MKSEVDVSLMSSENNLLVIKIPQVPPEQKQQHPDDKDELFSFVSFLV